MSAVPPEAEKPETTPVPRLLVELPSWPRVFFGNLRDLIFPPRHRPLELRSAPAAFWHDVFVKREFPWYAFFESGACHFLVLILLVGTTRFLALPPRIAPGPVFDRSHVVYYARTEYLPAIDTRTSPANRPRKADPELARQPIISVPREADNRSQTIVTPPSVKLKTDVSLPNIVAWSDVRQKPRLAIPDVPVTPAAEITRINPRMTNAVVPPPPEATQPSRRTALTLPAQVVAPPSDIRVSRSFAAFGAPQPSVIAPPASAESSPTRTLGDLNIGRAAVINPAPQLAVSEQRAIPGGRSSALTAAPIIVPPPAALSAESSSASPRGSPGRVVALNLHPALAAPDPPPGNRRGAFAATPEGHSGASGAPGSASGGPTGSEAGGNSKQTSDLPSGLYVGSAPGFSPVAGDPATRTTSPVNPNLTASVRPPRVTGAPRMVVPHTMQPEDPAKLSPAERAVFGNRKFYSLTLNLPNLNSAGGSWIVRFAELKRDADGRRDNAAATPAADLTQPNATRKVDPGYPTQLMRQNVAGTVILYAIIHADGTVGDVRVLRGVNDRLDRLASEALLQWRFEPATRNGAPVDIEATFQVPFKPTRIGDSF